MTRDEKYFLLKRLNNFAQAEYARAWMRGDESALKHWLRCWRRSHRLNAKLHFKTFTVNRLRSNG